MNCKYCGWKNDHNPSCPAIVIRYWDDGYSIGISGKRMPEDAINNTFRLGWVKGAAALEERENN